MSETKFNLHVTDLTICHVLQTVGVKTSCKVRDIDPCHMNNTTEACVVQDGV